MSKTRGSEINEVSHQENWLKMLESIKEKSDMSHTSAEPSCLKNNSVEPKKADKEDSDNELFEEYDSDKDDKKDKVKKKIIMMIFIFMNFDKNGFQNKKVIMKNKKVIMKNN